MKWEAGARISKRVLKTSELLAKGYYFTVDGVYFGASHIAEVEDFGTLTIYPRNNHFVSNGGVGLSEFMTGALYESVELLSSAEGTQPFYEAKLINSADEANAIADTIVLPHVDSLVAPHLMSNDKIAIHIIYTDLDISGLSATLVGVRKPADHGYPTINTAVFYPIRGNDGNVIPYAVALEIVYDLDGAAVGEPTVCRIDIRDGDTLVGHTIYAYALSGT